MHRRLCCIVQIVVVGCSQIQGLPQADRAAAEEVAVRHMASSLCNTYGYPCAVVFVQVNKRDADYELLQRLADLNALPSSRAEYFAESPGDVWQRTRDKDTKLRGEVLEILAVRMDTPERVHISVRYGVTSSILELTRIAGKWVVVGEEITAITVA